MLKSSHTEDSAMVNNVLLVQQNGYELSSGATEPDLSMTVVAAPTSAFHEPALDYVSQQIFQVYSCACDMSPRYSPLFKMVISMVQGPYWETCRR
jgi:hypothetical protein